MEDIGYLLDLALILLGTKALGLLTKRFQMPQVVGALLAGLILGPACFGILSQTDFITECAKIGVIVLMFSAGLETDIVGLKKCGAAAFVIAMLGVLVPLGGGFLLSYIFNGKLIPSDATSSLFYQNIFIGVILTATSVSITVETLKELGKLNCAAGNAIMGAAIIDDILGIIALTIITSVGDPESDAAIGIVLFKIVAFFVLAGIAGYVFYRIFKVWTEHADKDRRRFVIVAFVFCLLISYVAEVYFGVADITGAYLAGLVISQTQRKEYIEKRFSTLSYMMLSPIFFASIGIKVTLPKMSSQVIIFTLLIIVIATIAKIIGCGLGAKLFKYSNKECLQIGAGMVSRGEVALVVMDKGGSALMPSALQGPIVLMVVATTIIAPILLKLVFKDKGQVSEA